MRISLPKNRWWLGVAAGLFGVSFLFQNCTPQRSPQSESESSKSTAPIAGQPNPHYGGDGVDGKTYAHLGNCSAELDVDTRVFVSSDLSTAYVVRENCKDTAAPYANRISDISVKDSSSAMIVYKPADMILDADPTGGSQATTVMVSCHGDTSAPGLAVTVWTDGSGTNAQAVDTVGGTVHDTGTVSSNQTSGGFTGSNANAFIDITENSNSGGSITFATSADGFSETQNIICASSARTPSTLSSANFITTAAAPVTTKNAAGGTPVNPICGEVSQASNSRIFHLSYIAGSNNGDCQIQVRPSLSSTWMTVKQASCDQDFPTSTDILLPATGLGNWSGSTLVRLIRVSDATEMCDFGGTLECTLMAPSPVSTPLIDENCNGQWDDVGSNGKYN